MSLPMIQRLHSVTGTTPRGSTNNTAYAELEITVQSLSLTPQQDDHLQTGKHRPVHLYMSTTIAFYENIANNFNQSLSRLRAYLRDLYGGQVVETTIRGTLLLKVAFLKERVVALQCDQSCGILVAEIQRLVVTREMMDSLGVLGIQLNTELHAMSPGKAHSKYSAG